MKKYAIWLLAIGIGAVNAIILAVFEFVGVDVTNWLWNDLFDTDTHRWAVIPLAWLFGLTLTATILYFKAERAPAPEAELVTLKAAPSSIPEIAVVMVIGAVSLLAGASLGPEASLMVSSVGLGLYASDRWKEGPAKQTLVLASVGALLVSFVYSIILVAVPLLMLFKQSRQQKRLLSKQAAAVIMLAGIVSFVMTWLISLVTGSGGYGTIPTLPHATVYDLIDAVVIGFVAGSIAICLNWLIKRSWMFADWLGKRPIPSRPWVVGSIISLILGTLYLLGGNTIEFSGNIGSDLLISDAATLSAATLIGLIFTKLAATAWSKGSGYRGGLVFPSIYTGIALGLLAGHIDSRLMGAGAIVGGISGMLAAATGSPVVAAIFLIALLPIKLWPVAACAIIGTVAFNLLSKRLRVNARHIRQG
jgi:H+/Cl- antiporter ClcA